MQRSLAALRNIWQLTPDRFASLRTQYRPQLGCLHDGLPCFCAAYTGPITLQTSTGPVYGGSHLTLSRVCVRPVTSRVHGIAVVLAACKSCGHNATWHLRPTGNQAGIPLSVGAAPKSFLVCTYLAICLSARVPVAVVYVVAAAGGSPGHVSQWRCHQRTVSSIAIAIAAWQIGCSTFLLLLDFV